MNREIYQDIILSHFRSPKWKEPLDDAPDVFVVRNPSCGDIIRLRVDCDDRGILHLVHDAQGCAASVASCSIMCDLINGSTKGDASRKVACFLNALDSETVDDEDWNPALEIEALLFFRNVPARKRCVSLAWTCAQNALASLGESR